MGISPGRYQLDRDRGQVLLRTYRAGLAAAVGHDLTLEVVWWTAEVTVDEGGVRSVTAALDLSSLAVVSGSGAKALTDSDRRDILRNAHKALRTDRDPRAAFASTSVTPDPGGGGLTGTIDGTLTLAGVDRPLRLTVTALGGGRCRATGRVVQTEHGIKPYTGLMGALKLKDEVDIDAEADVAEFAGDAE